MISLEIGSSIDIFHGMTRYQPIYTIASSHDKP